jgi:hypothetical protein
MSSRARPWWASEGPVDGGIARDEDPVERLRAARRGTGDDATGDELAEPWLDAVAATMSSLAGAATPPPDLGDDSAETNAARNGSAHAAAETAQETAGAAHQPDVCGVCPICVGLRALAESRPELMNHLAEAARHVALAARSLRERPADAGDEARGRQARPGDGRARDGLEHIDLE